jgi:hypothetical protein
MYGRVTFAFVELCLVATWREHEIDDVSGYGLGYHHASKNGIKHVNVVLEAPVLQ